MSVNEVTGKAKAFIEEHIANLSHEDKARVLDEIEMWANTKWVEINNSDPNRMKKATERGSKGLREPEE